MKRHNSLTLAAVPALLLTLLGPVGSAYADPDTSGTITTEIRVGVPLGVAGTDNYNVRIFRNDTCALEDGVFVGSFGHQPGTEAFVPRVEGQYLRIVDRTNGAETDLTGCVGPVLPATSVYDLYAAVSGLAQVGHPLSATGSDVVPSNASLSYQWVMKAYGADVDIAGATSSTYRPTANQVGATIKVRITASAPGLNPETVTSSATQPVVFPPLTDSLGVFVGEARVGSTLHLAGPDYGDDGTVTTWSTFSDPDCGTGRVNVGYGYSTTLGSGAQGRYVRVIPEYDGASACVGPVAKAALPPQPAKKFVVGTSFSTMVVGKQVNVTAVGLAARETYTVSIGGLTVGTGTATAFGTAASMVYVPITLAPGHQTVRLVGEAGDRAGEKVVTVSRPGAISIQPSLASIKKGGTETVTLTGLGPNEPVTLRYDGTRISPVSARADNNGRYAQTFNVGATPGSHSVSVVGGFDGRTASKAIQVT